MRNASSSGIEQIFTEDLLSAKGCVGRIDDEDGFDGNDGAGVMMMGMLLLLLLLLLLLVMLLLLLTAMMLMTGANPHYVPGTVPSASDKPHNFYIFRLWA